MTKHNANILFWLIIMAVVVLLLVALKSILLPFVLGMLTAYFLDPATDRLERMGLSRLMATVAITACFFLSLLVLGLIAVPAVGSQLSGLLGALPGYLSEMEARYGGEVNHWVGSLPAEHIESARQAVTHFSGVMVKFVADTATGLFTSGMAFINLLSLILITPVVTFYLLRDWDSIVGKIDSLLPRRHAETIRTQLRIIDDTLAGFIHGQMLVCFLLALFYALGLSLAGLNFGIVVGLATGLLAIVPYAGFFLGFVVGMGIALFQFGAEGGFWFVLGVFMAGQLLESYVLTPRLVGERVGLHPVWVIFAMLAGGALFGFVGVLLAIPVAAIIGVLTRFALSLYVTSPYYSG